MDLSNKDYVRIENLEITSDGGAPFRDGISAVGGPLNHCVLKDLYIHHIDEFGVDIGDTQDLTIVDCVIEYCGFGSVGGPAGNEGGWRDVVVKNCDLSYNGHYYQGGPGPGPYARPDGFGIEPSSGPVEISYTVAEHNRGDGLDSKASNTYIHNSVVANNSCDGVKLWGGGSKVENTLIYGTGDGVGGASPWAGLVISDSDHPGASFEVVNVTIHDNPQREAYPMYIQYDSDNPIQVLMRNNIVSNGYGLAYFGDSVTVTADHNIFYRPGAEAQVYANSREYDVNDVDGGILGEGNLSTNPLFVSPAWGADGDYHLSENSPAIDSGSSEGAPQVDLEDDSRPVDEGFDMGAYEYGTRDPDPDVNPAPTVISITPSSATNDGVVFITNLKGTNFRDGACVQLIGPSISEGAGSDTVVPMDVRVVASTKITCALDLRGATPGKYTVRVENEDETSGTRAGLFEVLESSTDDDGEEDGDDDPDGQTDAGSIWYLAEGTTAWGFSTYLTIENPNNEDLTANVIYMPAGGSTIEEEVSLPAESQTTITNDHLREILGEKDFSTRVECREGKSIVVDRTMSWIGEGAIPPDAHTSIGVTSPDTTWYLPESSSAWGFECWLLIQNPNDEETTCVVTYMVEEEGPKVFEKKVPANSRGTFSMEEDIGKKDASIRVHSNMPVIPERAVYHNNRRGGHASIGTTTPSNNYFLAEGCTDHGFETYVLIQNPNDTATEVNVTYMTGGGPKSDPNNPYMVGPDSRETILVNEALEPGDFSTHVHGSNPIIAERAMYWDNGTGEACHNSIGMREPHTVFYFPDGQTSGGCETWTLIQNPNDVDVDVEISYLTPGGTNNVTFSDTIGANSRMTFEMSREGINGRAAILVECMTQGKKIMVERAMYWADRGAGTDSIGASSD